MNWPSSAPTIYTRENSSPLVEWRVSRFTRWGTSPSYSAASERESAIRSRKPRSCSASEAPSVSSSSRRSRFMATGDRWAARCRLRAALHEPPRAAQPLDHLVQRRGKPGVVRLEGEPVVLQAVTVATEGEYLRDRQEAAGLIGNARRIREDERETQVVEQVGEGGLPGPGELLRLEPRKHQGQGPGVGQGAMRLLRRQRDPEVVREVPQLPAPRMELARERERIEAHEIGAARPRRAEPPENREIEEVSVVGDEHIVAAERAEPGPHFLERRRVPHLRRPDPVDPLCLGGNGAAGADQALELVHDRAVPHPDRGELDHLARRRGAAGGFGL